MLAPPRTILDLADDLAENRRGITYPVVIDGREMRQGRTIRDWFDIIVTTASSVGITLPRRGQAHDVELNRTDYDRLFTACGGDRSPQARMCPGCGVNPAATCDCGMDDA